MFLKQTLAAATFALLWANGSGAALAAEPTAKKLQLYILAGQSNMVGHASYVTIPSLLTAEETAVRQLAKLVFKDGAIAPDETRSMIELRVKRDALDNDLRAKKITGEDKIAAAKAELKELQAKVEERSRKIKDSFIVSDRVCVTSIADGHKRSGPLTMGYGGSPEKIGPELGFGLSLERKTDAPILLIKTSWGGKSLHYDFRPPSAGPYELNKAQADSKDAQKIKENAGLNYRMMNDAVRDVLKDLKKHHPAYDAGAGYEIAGFVWFQGFNDQFDPAFHGNYQTNMIAFVKDVRKEYQTPNLPFVIGVLGTGATKEAVDKNPVSLGQRAAAAAPEFKDNVTSVESYPFFALDALKMWTDGTWSKQPVEFSQIGSDRPYHYMGSGKFFVRLGDALASAMFELRKKQSTGK